MILYGINTTFVFYGVSRYFDCDWISDYGSESELLFIGGQFPLRIHNIIQNKLHENYYDYVSAITIIQLMISNQVCFEGLHINENIQTAIQKLVEFRLNYVENHQGKSPKLTKHAKTNSNTNTFNINDSNNHSVSKIPEYVGKLFNKFCMNWTNNIKINMKYMNSSSNYQKIRSLFISDTNNGIIFINKLCILFPFVKRIKLKDNKNYLPFTKNTLTSIYKTIVKPSSDETFKSNSLIKLEFALSSSDHTNPLKDFNQMQYYYNKFKKHKWKIKYQTLRKSYDLYHIVSMTKIIDPPSPNMRVLNTNSANTNLLSPVNINHNPTSSMFAMRRIRTSRTSTRGSTTSSTQRKSLDDSCIDESWRRVNFFIFLYICFSRCYNKRHIKHMFVLFYDVQIKKEYFRFLSVNEYSWFNYTNSR